MQLALLLYLASISENLRSGVTFLFIVGCIVGVVAAAASLITGMTMQEKGGEISEQMYRANQVLRKIAVRTFFVWLLLALLGGLIPERKDVYVMAAGYVALKAVDSDIVRTTADHGLNAIEGWLDKELAKPDAAVKEKK